MVSVSIHYAGRMITTQEVSSVPITMGGRHDPLALTQKMQMVSVAVITNSLKVGKRRNTGNGKRGNLGQRD